MAYLFSRIKSYFYNQEDISNKTAWIIFFLIIASFLALRAHFKFFYFGGDQDIYFHMAKVMAEGATIYKDFFFAHPPLQLFFYWTLSKIFGFNYVLLALTGPFFTVASAFLIFKICNDNFKRIVGILGVFLFLSSQLIFSHSVFSMGQNMALFFVLLGILFFYEDKYFLSGIFFSLAGLTRFYAFVPSFAFLVYSLFKKQKKEIFYFSSGFFVFFLVNFIFLIIFKSDYLTPVFLYHFGKPEFITQWWRVLSTMPVLLLSIPSLFFLKRIKKKILPLFLSMIFYVLFFILLKNYFVHYFVIPVALLSILISYSLVNGLGKRVPCRIIFLTIIIISIPFLHFSLIVAGFFETNIEPNEIVKIIKENTGPNDQIFSQENLFYILSDRNPDLDYIDSNQQRIESDFFDKSLFLKSIKESKIIIIDKKYYPEKNRIRSYHANFFKDITRDCKEVYQSKNYNASSLFGFYQQIYYIYQC